MHQRIKDGTYRPFVEQLRQLLSNNGKACYDKAKKRSVAFTPGGVFTRRANAKLLTPSGLLNFDFDHPPNLADAKALLMQDPWIVYVFLSPSGDGLKVAVWADGIVDDATYKHAWRTVLDYFQRTYPDLAVANDKACKDISRLCYMSWDPDLYVNPTALLYAVPRYQPPQPKPKPTPQPTSAPVATAPPSPSASLPADRRQRYAQQAIDTAVKMIDASVPLTPTSAGTRHATRLKAARLLGGYVAGGILSYAEAYAALEAAVTRNTDDMARSMKTIVDGLAHGQQAAITLEQLEQERLDWIKAHTATMIPNRRRSPTGTSTAPAPAATAPNSTGTGGSQNQVWGSPQAWQDSLMCTKGGEVKETFANFVLALQHLSPWASDCWYDEVRELPMCGTEPLSDAMVGRVALALERLVQIPIRTLRLVQAALVQHCRATPRDVLQEWLHALPPWDRVPRLTEWLSDHAGAPKTAYGMDVSRLLPVSMVARALNPGCQYRNVIILEGPEDLGKSKLVKALAGPPWYRELSHGLEGKEAHMILQGVWLAELAELSSLSKTEDARLKSFITMETDDYIPKFANAPVSRRRRTVFVGTVNPEGDGAYLRGQTGNTRFLPIPVSDIHVDDVLTIRGQLFAEALVYYHAHPTDWWQLSSDGQKEAKNERDARRQRSVYEDSLCVWLQGKTETTWEEIAQHYLLLDAKERWKDKGLQMELAKALHALGWQRKQQWRNGKNVWIWRKS
jgi:hypothetical protein